MTDTKERQQDTPPAKMLEDSTLTWEQKERGVREIHDDYDIAPHVTFYRDGDRIGHFMGLRVNKYDAIALVHLGVRFLEADEVVVSLDTHITNVMENPRTGKPWAAGEMQNLCNDEGACDTGLITDAILTMRLGPSVPTVMINRKYHVNHSKREVHWIDPYDCMEEGEKAKIQGYMAESFAEAWSTEALAPEVPLPEGMPETEARAHRAVVGFRMMAEVVGGAAIPLEGLDDPEVCAVYEEYLTQEYVERDMKGVIGQLIVPLMRQRFGLDEPQ
jgi:hypothetical protein